MMGTVGVDRTALEEMLLKPGVVLVDWWAPWSPESRAFAQVFSAAADRYPEITFARVDVAEEEDTADEWDVHSVPTLMMYRDGVLVLSHPGAVAAEMLDQLIESVQTLDMAEIRRGLNGHRRPQAGMTSAAAEASETKPEQPDER